MFAPMGLHEENWPALVGIVTGIFAKEAVVGTLDALYTELAATDAGENPDSPCRVQPLGGDQSRTGVDSNQPRKGDGEVA